MNMKSCDHAEGMRKGTTACKSWTQVKEMLDIMIS